MSIDSRIIAKWPFEAFVVSSSTTISDPQNMLASDYGFNQKREEERLVAVDNRARLMNEIDVSRMQWMNQVHGITVFNADNTSENYLPEADACWTKQKGVALGVLTADCLPVVVVSKQGDWLGVAHAGWRGLMNGVLSELVQCADIEPSQLEAWIGPGISKRRYEVGEEVWSAFDDIHSSLVSLKLEPLQNKRFLDLSSIAESQLLGIGVNKVYQSGICTYDDPRFFSVRRNNQNPGGSIDGRLATVALLKRSSE